MKNNNIYACLEIGSFEIKLLVCNFREDRMYVLSEKCIPSIGFDRGQITNFEKLVKQIKKVKELIQNDLKQSLNQIVLTVPPIDTFVEPAIAKINLDVKHPIGEKDIRRLFRQVAQLPYVETHLPVNMIPRVFRIDENHLVQNPCGISGMSLALEAIRVFAPITIVSNIVHAVEVAGFKIADITTGSIPESLSVLNSPEMFARTCHINIGHSLTTITVINDGKIIHANALSIGGRDITRAIVDEFGISTEIANQLKIDFGRANDSIEAVSTEKVIYIDEEETKFITRGMLNATITSQCDRIFRIIKSYIAETIRIKEEEYHFSLAGGSAELPNIMFVLRENLLSMDSSLYRPSMLGIRNAKYSQLVGVAIFAHELALLVGSKNYSIKFNPLPLVLQKTSKPVESKSSKNEIAKPPEEDPRDDAKNQQSSSEEKTELLNNLDQNEILLFKERMAEIASEPEEKIGLFDENAKTLLGSHYTDDYLNEKLENSGMFVRFFDRFFNENDVDN